MIRDYGRSKEIAEHFWASDSEIATQSSNRERRAIEAEREVEAMKRLSTWKNTWAKILMQLYPALSSLVSLLNSKYSWGLDSHYQFAWILSFQWAWFDAPWRRKSGITFRVGQQIRIRVERADKMTGEIDFSYIPSEFDVIEKAWNKLVAKKEGVVQVVVQIRRKTKEKIRALKW